jgi:hypothetical protein
MDKPRPTNSEMDTDEGMLNTLSNYFFLKGVEDVHNPNDEEWDIWREAINQLANMTEEFRSAEKVMHMVALLIAQTSAIADAIVMLEALKARRN